MLGSNRWSLILAAGAGTRLERLTSDGHGRSVPKQFCSLNGGPSLLEEAIGRALNVTPLEQILVVVAQEHRAHWLSVPVPPGNVIVQPANRGTANGILLGATAILQRDSDAIVTVLPSDHYVEHEHVLENALEETLLGVEGHAASSAIFFLGIEPDASDTELGYIVAGEQTGGGYLIEEFVEKPSAERADALVRRFALWNSFILVARANALISLIGRRFPTAVSAFKRAWRIGARQSAGHVLHRLYEHLPTIDFSRSVVEPADAALRVVRVPHCGWTDLGTPQRVGSCLRRLHGYERATSRGRTGYLNLEEAYMRRIAATYPSAGPA